MDQQCLNYIDREGVILYDREYPASARPDALHLSGAGRGGTGRDEDEDGLQYPLPSMLFGFHAQQSCEKLMKALISAHGHGYPMTHNLEKLIRLLRGLGEPLPALPFNLLDLEPFAVAQRYEYGTELSEWERTAIFARRRYSPRTCYRSGSDSRSGALIARGVAKPLD